MTEVDRPSTSLAAPGGDEIGLAEIVGFFKRQGLVIGLCAGLAAVLAFVYFGFLIHPLFKATATLVVAPPSVSSQLQPEELTLQGYQRLLESDAVRAQTRSRLEEAGLARPDEPLGFQSLIFVSRREETTSLAPMLELVGSARQADQAAAVANTWAEVFLELTRELEASSTTASVNLVEARYTQVAEELTARETELAALESDYRRKYDETANAWDRRMASFRTETAELIAAYQSDTRRLIGDLLEERLAVTDAGDEQFAAKLRQLAAVRTELGQTSPVVTLEARSSAPSSENLLPVSGGPLVVLERADDEEIARVSLPRPQPRRSDLGSMEERFHSEQRLDPAYSQLTARASRLELELRQLTGGDWKAVAQVAGGLEELQRVRLAGLGKVTEERNAGLAALVRRSDRELDTIRRKLETESASLGRTVAQLELLEGELALDKNEAALARAQVDVGTVKVATRAVPTGQREPRRARFMTVLAALAGGFVGLLIAFFRDL